MELKKFADELGNLSPFEFKQLSFEVKRMFFVTDVPEGTIRGRCSNNYLFSKEIGWKVSEPLERGIKLKYDWIDQQVLLNKKMIKK